MKRLLLASVALSALTGAEIAAAADAPPEVIYPAGYPVGAPLVPPVVGPRFTFTGFYAGGTIGGAAGSSKYSETPSGTFMTVVPSFFFGTPPTPVTTVPPSGTVVSVPSNIAAVGTSSTAPRGVIGGAEVGYNWQIGHFVVGFETDFSGWDLSSSAGVVGAGYPEIEINPTSMLAGTPCPNNSNLKYPKCPAAAPGTAFTSTTSANSHWLFTARPRLGFANGNQLLYLTGGLAVSDFSFAQSIVGIGAHADRGGVRHPGGLDGRFRHRICAVVELVDQGRISLRQLSQPERSPGHSRRSGLQRNGYGQVERVHRPRRLRLPFLSGGRAAPRGSLE